MKSLFKNRKMFIAILLFSIMAGFFFLHIHNSLAATASGALTGYSLNPIDLYRANVAAAKELGEVTVKAVAGAIGNVVYVGIQWFLVAVLRFVGLLIPIAASIFIYIADAENLTKLLNTKAIYESWKMVRDLLNIAFIFVLLFSAFSTIFQVEKYNYKKILLTLVLMALLVNFSWPITRFIIDVSNTLMYTVAKNTLGDLSPNSKGLVSVFVSIVDQAELSRLIAPAQIETPPDVTLLLAAIVFTFILAITLISVSVMFVIRAVALAILLIFSPVAFVGSIFPSASGTTGKFWDYLFRYSFFGPVMMFMIYVSTAIMQGDTTRTNQIKKIASGQVNVDDISIVTAITLYVIPIVILWIGMGTAQSMSIAGADAVMGRAKKFSTWAIKTPIVAGAQKFEESVLAKRGLSPRAFLAGWKQRRDSNEKNALEPAAGAWRDRFNKIMTLNPRAWFDPARNTNYGDINQQGVISRKQKELADTSQESEYLMQQYASAKKAGDGQKMAAILRIMFNNNDQNEYMKALGKDVTPKDLKQTIFTELQEGGLTEQQTVKQMTDLSEIAFEKGNHGNYGMTVYDKKIKGFRVSEFVRDKDGNIVNDEKTGKPLDEQFLASAGKASNMESQAKMRTWHWNSFLTEIGDEKDIDVATDDGGGENGKSTVKVHVRKGDTGKLTPMGENMLNSITASEVEQLGRARRDFVDRLYERRGEVKAYAKKVLDDGNGSTESRERAALIDAFIQGIEARKVGGDKPETIIQRVRESYGLSTSKKTATETPSPTPPKEPKKPYGKKKV